MHCYFPDSDLSLKTTLPISEQCAVETPWKKTNNWNSRTQDIWNHWAYYLSFTHTLTSFRARVFVTKKRRYMRKIPIKFHHRFRYQNRFRGNSIFYIAFVPFPKAKFIQHLLSSVTHYRLVPRCHHRSLMRFFFTFFLASGV